MFEAFKMKEWVARMLPAVRRDIDAHHGAIDSKIFLDQMQMMLQAPILRVEMPAPSAENRKWHVWMEQAGDHGLPLPFEQVILEVPLNKYNYIDDDGQPTTMIDPPNTGGLLLHVGRYAHDEQGERVDLTELLAPSARSLFITKWYNGHWTMTPLFLGDVHVVQGRRMKLQLRQWNSLGSTPVKPDERIGNVMLRIILAALGYAMSCRPEPHKIPTMRRAMLKRHRPRLDEYRVAVIDPDKLKAYEKRAPVGSHASPIPHDRRGHLRQLKSGRMVWVRDCRVRGGAVAAEGFLVKDYVIGSPPRPPTEPVSV